MRTRQFRVKRPPAGAGSGFVSEDNIFISVHFVTCHDFPNTLQILGT
ncbi:MAG: hypothetical protein ACE5D7_11205 [Fidelibacterota bacterium]